MMLPRRLTALVMVLAAISGSAAERAPAKKPKINFFTADNGLGGYFTARLLRTGIETAFGDGPRWNGFDLGNGGPAITGAPDYSSHCAGANLGALAAALNDAPPPDGQGEGLIRLDQRASSEDLPAFDIKAIYQPGQNFSCSGRLAPSP